MFLQNSVFVCLGLVLSCLVLVYSFAILLVIIFVLLVLSVVRNRPLLCLYCQCQRNVLALSVRCFLLRCVRLVVVQVLQHMRSSICAGIVCTFLLSLDSVLFLFYPPFFPLDFRKIVPFYAFRWQSWNIFDLLLDGLINLYFSDYFMKRNVLLMISFIVSLVGLLFIFLLKPDVSPQLLQLSGDVKFVNVHDNVTFISFVPENLTVVSFGDFDIPVGASILNGRLALYKGRVEFIVESVS